jgi:LysM repeat protein
MTNKSLDQVSRILPLIVAEGEVSLTEAITWSLPGEIQDFSEPEITLLETNATVLSNEVCVHLVVQQTTYYVTKETETVGKITTTHPLTKILQVSGVKAGEQAEIAAEAVFEGNCRTREFTLRNKQATMLTGDCKLRVHYSVYSEQEIGFSKPTGLDGEILSEKIEVEAVCSQFQQTIDVALPFTFDQVPKSLGNLHGKFINMKGTPLCGWVKVEGEISARVPNMGENGRAMADVFVFPVKYFIEVPEAKASMLSEISGRVELLVCQHEKGETAGILRGLLHVKGHLRLVEALDVAMDSRSHQSFYHKKHHHSHHNPYLIEEIIGVGSSQTLIEREIIFPRQVRTVREPVDAQVRNIQHEIIPNKVIVRGVLDKQLFAVDAETGVVFAQDVSENFVHFVDLPRASPGMRARVTARVEFVNVEVNPGGETARQVTIIELRVKVTRFVKKEIVISPISPSLPIQPYPSKPTQKVYIVRSGDTVWKIANMFGVSMNAIIAANNLSNPNLIFPGQQLIIPW